MISAFNISNSEYAIGLATAFAPRENSVFMKIPMKSSNAGVINFDMIINTNNKTELVNATTDIKQEGLSGLTVYPNPVEDVLKINITEGLNNAVASVFNIEGKLVLVQLLNLNENSINVIGLSSGIYTIKLSGSGSSYSQKFIKK
jgi:hypothetical protein